MSARQPTEVVLKIEHLTQEGLGASQYNERPYHVRNALPGEEVRARILKKRKGTRFAEAIAVEGQPHAQRRASSCVYFPRCGGCSLHHFDYQAGLMHKHEQLVSELARAGVQARCIRPATSVGRLHYRRKARLGVRQVGDQVLVGFRESFSNRVSKSDNCQTLTHEISKLIKPLKVLLSALSIGAKVPQIEVAQGDQGVSLMLRHLVSPSVADLAALEDFARHHEVCLLMQSGGPDSVVTLSGDAPPLLDYALPEFGLQLQFDPRQFTQVNAAMNETLVSHALTWLKPKAGEHIVDLFCGIGNFSLPIARSGARVTGYELDPSAIERADLNSHRNGLAARTEFHTHDLYTQSLALQDLRGGKVDALLLDPPRSGAGPHLMQWLATSSVQRVVYVSCNPVTFATDALGFTAQGFELENVGVYDMFPNTSHIETLGSFVRGNGG